MPNYTKNPKDFFPLTERQFITGFNQGHFVNRKHKGFIALLYHTGVRVSEALRATREQFQLDKDRIRFDVGPRLKHGLQTAPLPILYIKPFSEEIVFAIDHTQEGKRVFPYCRKTGYNIVARVFTYPHYFRLTKISMLFRKGYTIDQVRTWTGHKEIGSLTPYVGFANVEKMAEA